jgi:hypothetical protein
MAPGHGWEDTTEMDLRETVWGGMDWIDLAQDRALVNTIMNLRVSQNVGKFLSSCALVASQGGLGPMELVR